MILRVFLFTYVYKGYVNAIDFAVLVVIEKLIKIMALLLFISYHNNNFTKTFS